MNSTSSAGPSGPDAARIAAHRFGLGEPNLTAVGSDAAAWLTAQIGPADPQRGEKLATLVQAVRSHAEFQRMQRERKAPEMATQAMAAQDMAAKDMATKNTAAPKGQTPDMRSSEQPFADHFRDIAQADVRASLGTAAMTQRPFAERLALFWANHFTVSAAKGSARALVGAFEREAIRPHIAGPFETLLKAAVTHGAMLRYLDNDQSAGPHSQAVQRQARRLRDADAEAAAKPRHTGLNENLAREVLELHTLGAASKAYTQADVTAFAAVLTGWRVPVKLALEGTLPPGEPLARFDAAWHEPGTKVLLGKRYAEGPQALDAVLHDLATHPATAQFVALKLARHFVADEPPAALVQRLAQTYRTSGGNLGSVYRELINAPEAWEPVPTKLKTPAEFVVSTARLLGLGEQPFVRNADAGVGTMGQRMHAAPSPAGWPDRAEDWLGPDALWKRVEWATRVADKLGRQTDARALARASLGPGLSAATAQQIERAADGPQALALLLLAPEFQRR